MAALAAALSGIATGSGFRAGAILSAVAAVGLGLIALAASRFELFVGAILAVRSALDAAKLGGPAGLDPAALVSGLFLLAGILWLAVRSQETEAPPSPLIRPLFVLTVAGAISIAFAPRPLASAVDVLRLATVLVILMVLNRLLVDRRATRVILAAIFVSALIPLAMGAYQVATGTGFRVIAGFYRVLGTFVHPNPFAIYLTLVLILGAALLPWMRIPLGTILAFLLVACAVFLVLTYTRSAWIGTLAGLLTVGLLQSRGLLVLIAISTLVVALMVPSAGARFGDLAQQTRASGAPANSLVWRFEYWNRAVNLSQNPVFGIGLGSVREVTDVGKEPHNDFVRVYVETGLVGLLAYLWFLGSLVTVARRAVAEARPGLDRGVAVGFAGAVVAFLIISIVANVLTQLVILWYLATLAAAANAAWWRARQPIPEPS